MCNLILAYATPPKKEESIDNPSHLRRIFQYSGLSTSNNSLTSPRKRHFCGVECSLDERSQHSFLTKGLADCLQVQPNNAVELSLSTFSTGTSCTSKFDVATYTTNCLDCANHCCTDAYSGSEVNTNLPYLNGLHPISSAEQFSITLLIGADQYWNIVEDHVIRGNGPTGRTLTWVPTIRSIG